MIGDDQNSCMFHLFVIDAWGWIVLTNSTVVIEKAKQNKSRGKRGTEVMIIFMASMEPSVERTRISPLHAILLYSL